MSDQADPRRYLDIEREAAREFAQRAVKGELVMLNILRFREVADYSLAPELAPETPISGRDAYTLYIANTLPLLQESGGDILFLGEGGPFLVGPPHERWDRVALVKHGTVTTFLEFARNPNYLAGVGHRNAALEDSRLLPLNNLRTEYS